MPLLTSINLYYILLITKKWSDYEKNIIDNNIIVFD